MLVVDDSRFVRASLVRGLTGRFRIQQADSGERAWELLLLDGSIGAILSDLSMPGIDGFELLRRVRGSLLDRVRDLPFAMLSGSDDAAQRERAMALGADRFVVKGDGVGELADWIAGRLHAERDAARANPPTVASGAPDPAPAPNFEPGSANAGPQANPDGPAHPTAATMAASARPTAAVQEPTPASPEPRSVTPSTAAPSTVTPSTVTPSTAAPGTLTPSTAAPSTVTPSTAAPITVAPTATAAVTRLVPDPLPRWFTTAAAAAGRSAAGAESPPTLIRMHAPGLDDLPARLRRGVRAADALFVESVDTAWLCVPASAGTALRLALRFGLLAAGRQANAPGGAAARVTMCMHPVDVQRPGDALAALLAAPPEPAAGGLTVRAFAGAWGPAWHCTLPWPAVRLLAT